MAAVRASGTVPGSGHSDSSHVFAGILLTMRAHAGEPAVEPDPFVLVITALPNPFVRSLASSSFHSAVCAPWLNFLLQVPRAHVNTSRSVRHGPISSRSRLRSSSAFPSRNCLDRRSSCAADALRSRLCTALPEDASRISTLRLSAGSGAR
jgi:hypothetical protein